MKSFSTVYNKSKKQVLEAREKLYESQKVAVINVLKETYMITGNMSDLPADQKKEMAKKVFEYWSPKTGINKAGIKLLNENMITLSPNSTKEDIRLYIQKQTKKNLIAITEAFRSGNGNVVVETFKNDIEPAVGKTLKENFITNTVWNLISERIKFGLD
ncbi:MAG: hypothetical protein [Hatfieldvirus porci]|uniref:DUF2059 domain-containing protein n=1 Tax=phage Lak_Megaphage_RVC_JS4_GC31 TaxID=3109228 RepID=A0ABZ0Z1T8_9CAUD|nr:MAG: hypothetical protein [phage Lak_Megaphage_RVC_AP3_GC31]WQJ53163.1 MAG: hypothetical protein [phage Lak_Megaphage_RVC_JS4_GC31]